MITNKISTGNPAAMGVSRRKSVTAVEGSTVFEYPSYVSTETLLRR